MYQIVIYIPYHKPRRVAPTQEFNITLANAESSPGVLLNINGTLIPVLEYQKKWMSL